METLRNFSSIIHSHPFTFLLGPNHTKLTIQSGLANHVSRPLDHLMNSGETRESKHHIAVLEDEDVETFAAFCEYAYTGDYRVPPPGSREDEKERVVNNPFKGFLRGETAAEDAVAAESVGSPAFSGFAGFPPPPAPSPPRSLAGGANGANGVGARDYGYGDGHGYRDEGKSWEEMRMAHVKVPEQAIDDDDDDDDDDDGLEPGSVPVSEPEPGPGPGPGTETVTGEDAKPVERPVAQEIQQPPEPEDTPEAKGKKGKKNKKDKKKKGTEEAPNLTPPTTPPAKHTENPAEAIGEPGPEIEAADGGQVETVPEPVLPIQTEKTDKTVDSSDQPDQPDQSKNEEEKKEKEEKEKANSGQKEEKPEEKQTFPLFMPRDQGINMWDEFKALDYVDQRPTYPIPRSMVATACTPEDLPYLTFHAKVYVFATRYLIPALAQLCLQKLHRDLLYLAFPEDPESTANANAKAKASASTNGEEEENELLQQIKARMVLDLLHYTYCKTTRLEPTTSATEEQQKQRPSQLRKLVVHYAACRVRDLAAFRPESNSHDRKPSSRGLQGLLDSMTELASDLVFRMM